MTILFEFNKKFKITYFPLWNGKKRIKTRPPQRYLHTNAWPLVIFSFLWVDLGFSRQNRNTVLSKLGQGQVFKGLTPVFRSRSSIQWTTTGSFYSLIWVFLHSTSTELSKSSVLAVFYSTKGGALGSWYYCKRPTSVGIKIPTSHSFRVGWHATLIRVKTNFCSKQFYTMMPEAKYFLKIWYGSKIVWPFFLNFIRTSFSLQKWQIKPDFKYQCYCKIAMYFESSVKVKFLWDCTHFLDQDQAWNEL